MTGTRPPFDYVRRLFRYAFNHKRLLAAAVLIGVVGFLTPFLFPWTISRLIDYVVIARPVNGVVPTYEERLHWLWVYTIIGGATALLFAATGYVRNLTNVKLSHRIVIDIRRDLFDHLQRLSLHFYSKTRTGSIVNRIIHEVHGVTGILNAGIILVFLDVGQLIVALWLLCRISVPLTLATMVVFPLYVLTFKFFNPRVRRASERLHQDFCRIFGNVQEQMANVALVKTYSAEERESRKFQDDNEIHYQKVLDQHHVGNLVGSISEILVHLGTTLIIGMGGYLALQGKLTAGDITAYLGYVGIMYGPIRRFADLNLVYQNSLAAMRRVFRVLDIMPRIVDRPHSLPRAPERGEVRYDHVFFRYSDDSEESRAHLDEEDGHTHYHGEGEHSLVEPAHGRWIINDISFTAAPGQRVALVGPSGGGKTTLVSLLPRLYDVGQGKLLIDGHDIRDYSLKALRQAIGIVQQDSFVFSGSIRDNLRYGRPEATEEEMIRAAKAANAHGFITNLPDGYDTHLGERGVNLSGGQRQRLSIARALLKNPRILILDEATSALDSESEALVQDALNTLMKGRTCIIIAHRLSTVRHADKILVLRDGQIVESGNHQELLEADGMYARLVRQQFGAHAAPAPPPPAETNLQMQ